MKLYHILLFQCLLLASCTAKQERTNTANQNSPTPNNQPKPSVTKDLSGIYTTHCPIDSTRKLQLRVSRSNNQYIASLRLDSNRASAQGTMLLDTVNYEKEDSIFSFRNKNAIYSFVAEKEGTDYVMRLLNEDYKKDLSPCFDGKSIALVKGTEPRPHQRRAAPQ